MASLLRRIEVDCFADIAAAIALYRPGTLSAGIADDYANRKIGKEKVLYCDERLEPLLKETYGILLYQEQIMQIAMLVGGFSASESYRVHEALSKKSISEIQKVHTWQDGSIESMENHWFNGAKRNGFSQAVTQQLWEDMLKYAQYAFCKAHAAAYALLVIQTAWFKSHCPVEFTAATLQIEQKHCLLN